MELANRSAIVLGGTSGIGLAAALRLKQAGAKVLVGGRSEENLARAAEQGLQGIAIDVLDRDALQSLFAAHEGFDILVNAATGGERASGPFLNMDLDAYQGSFRKLWGYTNSVNIGAPLMAEHGSIVLVSGAPARKARPGSSALASVGGAVEAFARAVAAEIAPRRINIVSPGLINTPMFPGSEEERAKVLAKVTASHLIPRAGTADEVAAGILFMLENDFVTGTTIDVDGGWLLT